MRPILNGNKWHWTIDKAFKKVMNKCKESSRKGQEGTWIFPELEQSMYKLHEQGHAHSVEVWEGEELIGGLYGLAFGDIFIGESMFADKSNASKFGFINLVRWLSDNGYNLIDCQQETPHLKSLGATMMSGQSFYERLKTNMLRHREAGKWVLGRKY